MLERFSEQAESRLFRERAVTSFQFVENRAVVLRIDDDADMSVILCRRSNHAGSANVDVFNDFFECRAARYRRLKRIEVYDDQIDRKDSVLFHFCDVLTVVAQRENSAVQLWMQRFNP